MAIYNSHLLLRQYCRIGSAVGTTAAMTLLIVMYGTEMNVKSVFALLLEEVTRPKQALSE
jgi:hypothetical protein